MKEARWMDNHNINRRLEFLTTIFRLIIVGVQHVHIPIVVYYNNCTTFKFLHYWEYVIQHLIYVTSIQCKPYCLPAPNLFSYFLRRVLVAAILHKLGRIEGNRLKSLHSPEIPLGRIEGNRLKSLYLLPISYVYNQTKHHTRSQWLRILLNSRQAR